MSTSPKPRNDTPNGTSDRLTEEQVADVAALRDSVQKTRRAMVPALEEILYEPLPVLDQGFIRVIDYMGDDAAIVQAARVSYGRGTKQISNDRGLINYLIRHRHTSAVRDVRNQAAHQAADLHRAAVDQAPHRQRQ